jgi:hypothetical protein
VYKRQGENLAVRSKLEQKHLPCEQMAGVVSLMLEASEGTADYTYADRILPQLDSVVGKLALQMHTNQAYISLWQDGDIEMQNPPCLIGIWLRICDKQLHMHATFRSHSIYGAWLANARQLLALQAMVANRLPGVATGLLHIASLSAHIYTYEAEAVAKLPTSQAFTEDNFVVSHDTSGDVLVQRMQSGEVAGEWRCRRGNETSLQRCLQAIAEDVPSLSVGHAMYIAKELAKYCFVI